MELSHNVLIVFATFFMPNERPISTVFRGLAGNFKDQLSGKLVIKLSHVKCKIELCVDEVTYRFNVRRYLDH